MRAILFAAIAAIILLAGCAAAPLQQKQAPGPEIGQQPAAPQAQEQQPAGSWTDAGEVENWLNSYDADLNQSVQDIGSAG